jgi:hypothetical protein
VLASYNNFLNVVRSAKSSTKKSKEKTLEPDLTDRTILKKAQIASNFSTKRDQIENRVLLCVTSGSLDAKVGH